MLLHKMTEYGSLDNHGDDIRWSFDRRYQPIRPADRPLRLPRLRRPQFLPSRAGSQRPRRVGQPVVGSKGPDRRRGGADALQRQVGSQRPATYLRLNLSGRRLREKVPMPAIGLRSGGCGRLRDLPVAVMLH